MLLAAPPPDAHAQSSVPPPPASGAGEPLRLAVRLPKLSLAFRRQFGPDGLLVDSLDVLPDGSTHAAHFQSDLTDGAASLSSVLALKLANLPRPSPASGFNLRFDPELGVYEQTTLSFGPIMTERADTIGAGRFAFGSTFQRFGFDTIDGRSLSNVPAIAPHVPIDPALDAGAGDVIQVTSNLDLSVDQLVFGLSYGLTDAIDLTLAVPWVSVDVELLSRARIVRLSSSDPTQHFFRDAAGGIGDVREYLATGSASGLGDVNLRAKGRVHQSEAATVAVGCEVRFPTGDEEELLGAGAFGARPFAVASTALGIFSPQVNLAYQWNGRSVLGGDPATGREGELADELQLAVGVHVGAVERVTLAFDVIGRQVLGGPRVRVRSVASPDGSFVAETASIEEESSFQADFAAGLKVQVLDDLLVDANVLAAIDDAGLRDSLTPLIGIEYGFGGAPAAGGPAAPAAEAPAG